MKKKTSNIKPVEKVRTFDTGATRNSDADKLDFEGFLSPFVLERYAEYMHIHRLQSDGRLRESDNWQKGMSVTVYIKSLWRHFMAVWKGHRTGKINEDDLCALIFNAMGMLHEILKQKRTGKSGRSIEEFNEFIYGNGKS